MFKDHDYDMSIVAHVEPRDLPAVFGNPQYYTQYNNPQLQADIAAADAGTTDEQVTNMKKAAQELSQDAAADFLFLLPTSSSPTQGSPGCRRTRSPSRSTCRPLAKG